MHKTSKEELEYWDKILDEYENSIGLPSNNSNTETSDELNQYLTMSRDVIERLTPEDCAQISYRLGQMSFHIQRTLNREIARHNWAEDTAKMVIAEELNNYKGYGYIEKFYQAVKNNDRASSLYKIQKYAKQRMDRLSYLSNSLKNLSDILLAVQRNKVNNVKHA
jgi:Mg2+ and Co2+ transporter CorA